jgi:hypothetical protein
MERRRKGDGYRVNAFGIVLEACEMSSGPEIGKRRFWLSIQVFLPRRR